MKNKVTIIDLQIGNLGSISNMIKKLGGKPIITSDYSIIEDSEKIILAGVGAFDSAMKKIHDLNLFNLIQTKAKIDKIPFWGICLGMQLLTKRSMEGSLDGLNLIDAETISFRKEFNTRNINEKIPHMGWNHVINVNESLFTKSQLLDSKFYFVHSYFVKCNLSKNIIMKTHYGIDFHSAIGKDNIFGTQFHPEKSDKIGLKIIDNFISL